MARSAVAPLQGCGCSFRLSYSDGRFLYHGSDGSGADHDADVRDYGCRRSVRLETRLFWLMQGALGLPVFAPGAVGGIARFFGPTGGYLFSFPICAMLTGWMVEHGFSGRSFVKGFIAMLAGNILCLIIGGAWLAVMMGFAKGMALGVTPFIAGAFTKSVLGAAVLLGISAGTSRKHN